jgi:large subunit ribosomal protein L15
MKLSNLVKQKNKESKKKRVGRGYGSGKGGHTVGLGTKGQKARGSRKIPVAFEGGQVPLYRKMPKKPSFKGTKRSETAYIPLVSLNQFKDGDKVNPTTLVEKGFLDKLPRDGVKILANGNLHKKLELSGFFVSEGARKRIEKSGSKIVES